MIASRISRPQAFTRSIRLSGTRQASHGPSYNQPSGYLFGERVPKGEKRQKESWERIYMWGMFGGFALATVIQVYKPDTSIQTWAMEEAKARMEARGVDYKYKPSSA